MNWIRSFVFAALIGACVFLGVNAGTGRYVETDLVVDQQVNGSPVLVDANGVTHVASFFDANLVNPWGIATSASGPFWISDNGAGMSTTYNSSGSPLTTRISIPAPGDPLGNSGTPTGAVFNTAQGAGAFTISGFAKDGTAKSAPAVFLFATEDGTIVGWNPGVNPAGFAMAKAGTYGIIAVPNPSGTAVYKGLAIATDAAGITRLYATNFHDGSVDVFNASFQPINVAGAFVDGGLPKGYAPFNIAPFTVDGATRLYVTYAVQDADKHDDVAGESHGIVDTYLLDGSVQRRFAQHGQLNSPWGMAMAPAGFGELGGTLWIGNFGNGHIDAYDPVSGQFAGKVRDAHNQTIVIEGLWGLRLGNGGSGGFSNTMYFTAGSNGESDGLFGALTAQ